MKTLLLLRHAKSSWNNGALQDFDRPLNERGKGAAPLMGGWMRKQKLRPEAVISSPAERARQTIVLVMEAAKFDPGLYKFKAEVQYDERLYGASAAQLLEVITQIEPIANQALLVGHNPGLEDLIEMLTGKAERVPTAALACVNLNVGKWDEVQRGGGSLEWLMKPKELAKS